MQQQKTSPRFEYREQEMERTEQSVTLAEKFPDLTSLTASLTHFGPAGMLRIQAIKYSFNIAHAKSLFRFDCHNPECVGGDFDLSVELAKAVAARHTSASGEVICQGWRSRETIGAMRCQNILRYKLSLGYKRGAVKPR